MASIGGLPDEEWRVAYRDGTGRDNQATAAEHSQNHRGQPEHPAGRFLGPKANVADAERAGIALALSTHDHTDLDMLFICTDSLAVKWSIGHLGRGRVPRSPIEVDIKAALRQV